ncbi:MULTISPECIES: S66 peptidase family protein [unclassified Corallococcus]|uniref:S66 peptidase family protein n=1 Tax=unclassified Corallococcus TaxID=2685029 RepID=UPI001A8D1301|nr:MULTISPECIES: LD-carboxypeptidase [unclassified Corallococcus]MBN9687358.1 LD-carboxypeptidase [Corallococcus sp. NCSPR001]WAS88820.1 LD-carboxypeptidase [Corallococcus sp. NCRR]
MKRCVRWLKPLPLRPRDTVQVVAPAGPFEQAPFEAGLRILSERYSPVVRPDIGASHRYLAGDDSRRQEELSHAFLDRASRAIFCARGGYGSSRLLPELPIDKAGPVAFTGFSDLTSIHCALQALHRVSIHAPVLTQLGRQSTQVHDYLFRLLESSEAPPPLTGNATYVPGTAEGVLVGGNLSVFSRLLGTPYMPPLDGAVLLLEDVTERPYRIDRMWTHLRLAGVFSRVRGIVLGDFTACEEKDANYSSADVLRELARDAKVPCAAGFPIGHGAINYPVALGTHVRLDADAARLTFLEGAVSPG